MVIYFQRGRRKNKSGNGSSEVGVSMCVNGERGP